MVNSGVKRRTGQLPQTTEQKNRRMIVVFLLCLIAGKKNGDDRFYHQPHLVINPYLRMMADTGSLSLSLSCQVGQQQAKHWMCAPPATLMPHVTTKTTAREKFVTASMGLLEMEEPSVKVKYIILYHIPHVVFY